MGSEAHPLVSEVGPRDAWAILSDDNASILVDVRSRPEWMFVGGPDLSELGKEPARLEWKTWPDMTPDPAFAGALLKTMPGLPSRILFICRSGARLMEAATAVARTLETEGRALPCINVAEGFEGDLDTLGHRGGLNGWKARGLAWRQS
ncbi:rhodanese-like domain-containing protein [Jannaschia ovalis]|uniref:Rhodanese-like domain-containing protein n=1 Tax=Jannaschia ovalis TaxID=3038773 RepID=A0ABY8L875_9RHOB|nr:rhodanese-like domain-containing protein [Jannaschia sp. GRR-S6-38]WGH77496.1 rhodanese-like domain-containing protein [Jannaschia sp. GRR-S6-38]